MRIVGYILLLTGFLWLGNWFASVSVPLPRSIFVEMKEKYPPVKMYSQIEVLEAVRSVTRRFMDNSIQVLIPGILMLFGGILLDLAGRRSANQKRSQKEGKP